jgi:phage-related tail fiber protein
VVNLIQHINPHESRHTSESTRFPGHVELSHSHVNLSLAAADAATDHAVCVNMKGVASAATMALASTVSGVLAVR